MLPCIAVQAYGQPHLNSDDDGHTMQATQMQQAADQESASSQLNPAPVSASTGQTAITQVVTSNSRKHPPLGQLTQTPAQQVCRFRHDVELKKHPKVGSAGLMLLCYKDST